MESLEFLDLPGEMIDEVINRTEIMDMARLLGTGRTLRGHLTDVRRENIDRQRKLTVMKRRFIAEAQSKALGVKPIVIQLADLELSSVLGPSFPELAGYKAINFDTLAPWLYIYLFLNDLKMGMDSYHVDETLASLSLYPKFNVGDMKSFQQLLKVLHSHVSTLRYEPAGDIKYQVAYGYIYLSLVRNLISEQMKEKTYDIDLKELVRFLLS